MAFVPACVPEDVYDQMIGTYLRSSVKEQKRWKYSLKNPDGSKSVVRFDGQLMYFYRGGLKYALIGEESAKKHGLPYDHPGHDAFADTVDENATGNHTGKNHPIRVPTKPNEPVRG